MKIVDILKQRSENPKDEVKIELKLYNLADDLEKRSRNHLKRITNTLPEFDIHDEKHSEKVIENIEKLLGDEKLLSLSTYELFLLHLSAFFHDCAMAPSDWEINTMKLTEGNETHFQNDFSIKHDLKTPLQYSVAQKTITENKANLYKKYDSDVKEWMFTPRNEDELIKYLSTLLIEYQNYRNGFADKLKKVKSQLEFNELSEFIRIDYIRATHHTRIETYIKNLETKFSQAFEQPAWGKKLAHDLSLICRSHGEDASFINSFSQNAQYYGSENANLQFVAIMLRLGDIIHFSYDRAPIDLRSSKLFKSEYSFQQWAIKNSGVNYSIEKGKISYRAYCETPETYFKLHQYIDWIEIEIQNYFRFQRQWSITYIENLQDKVERINIINDEDSFLPKRGLNFSLNQNKILDLLMGVGLYKDKYACLRELYQNSLDAVRCMLSKNEVNNSSTKGLIEFKIIREDEKSYLYCLDNGIGMTKDIIENYLLKIGNSYYKSSDFFKQQANWGGKFTPTSQFGIGILSCFMIGSKLEITTKTINGEYLSCAIDGLHESFYYKKTSHKDKEFIPVSGTIIKILLDEETASQINITKADKIDLILLGIVDFLPDNFESQFSDKKIWENHLYTKLNRFVQIIPDNISLSIDIENDKLTIPSKPTSIDFINQNLSLREEDYDFIDFLIADGYPYPLMHKYAKIKDFIETYEIHVQHENSAYISSLTLPKSEFIFEGIKTLYSLSLIGTSGICIDGIRIAKIKYRPETYSSALADIGIINFYGELRPGVSIDRTSIIDYPDVCEQVAEKISELFIKQILEVAQKHINKHQLTEDSNTFTLVWKYIFSKVWFADSLLFKELAYTKYGEFQWTGLNNKLVEKMSISQFLNAKKVIIKDLNLYRTDEFTKHILFSKIISAKEIKIKDSNISIQLNSFTDVNIIGKKDISYHRDVLICADDWDIFDTNFDIVSGLYPLIPQRLFSLLNTQYYQEFDHRIKIMDLYSNGLNSFFSQSPLLVHEKMGLYTEDDDGFDNNDNYVYNFENKRHKIRSFHLNNSDQNCKYVLIIFINSYDLTKEEIAELKKYTNSDPTYVKGVKEGWSLLATSMEKDNIIIVPGRVTRDYLVSLISDEFWEEYKDYTFKFTDNTIMQKSN